MKEDIFGLCSDHAGFEMKQYVIKKLEALGIEYKDFGTYSDERCDYPDFAHRLGSAIETGELKRGIALCGSGNGISMTLNKYPHVRAALCWTEELAGLGRAHNDANILSIPARFVSEGVVDAMVDAFIQTPFEGGRHIDRVNKIAIR